MSEALLLAAAKRAEAIIEHELKALLTCHCLLNHDLTPIEETLEPDAEPAVREYREVLDQLRASIADAEARGVA